MQALYQFFQSSSHDLPKGEREMMRSIDRVYDLYLMLLQLMVEVHKQAQNVVEEGKNKRLPSKEDLNPNLRFVENKVLKLLSENYFLIKGTDERKINWADEGELIRKIFNNLKASPEYEMYLNSPSTSFLSDKEFVIDFFKKHIADSDAVEHYIEERSIYWANDLNMAVAPMIIKTLQNFNENSDQNEKLLPLLKDAEEDRQFVLDLYRKTIISDKESETLIGDKTKNWEVERIAMMDVLLMKMALTELVHFNNIPVKVTLNEYIEISKLFSTPRSKVFINGILDKIVLDLKASEKIKKTGRGLIE